MLANPSSALKMQPHRKQQIVQAVYMAIRVLNLKNEAMDECRRRILSNIHKYQTNVSFTFNASFLRVSSKLVLGYLQQRFANKKIREAQVSAEALAIARETGVSYKEVNEIFVFLMGRFL